MPRRAAVRGSLHEHFLGHFIHVQFYLGRPPVRYGASFLARVLMLNTKRRWIWGFWGALIVMGVFHGRHSQCLMEFVSSKCRVQGNLGTGLWNTKNRLSAIDLGGVGQLGIVRAIQIVRETTRRLFAAHRHHLRPRIRESWCE